MVFAVFLIAIAVSIPISVSMILGSVAPIEILHKGGSVVQLLNNTFSGANSTPILAVPLFILGGVIMAKGGDLPEAVQLLCLFCRPFYRGPALCGDPHLFVLWGHFWFRPGYHGCRRSHVRPLPDRPGL